MRQTDRQAADQDGEIEFHPAFARPHARPLPAGKAVLIIAVALGFGLLFNSSSVLHSALGMRPGPAKTVALSIARPVDWLAQRTWLDRPKLALDSAFGHEPAAAVGLADGSDETEARRSPRTKPTEPAIVSPTRADPLRVLVLGDSQATYVGQQMDELAAQRGLISVAEEGHDGTGVTTPEYFDWRAAAVSAASRRRAQTVVMVLGSNDFQDMTHAGETLRPGTAEWTGEYARRTALIMKALIDSGAQRVYWVAPPRSRPTDWDAAFQSVNTAVRQAAATVAGAHYVDVSGAPGGQYSDYETVDGRQVRARQPDGIHWTFDGARLPAEAALHSLQSDYGDIG